MTRSSKSSSSGTSSKPDQVLARPGWAPKQSIGDMVSMLRSSRESLPSLLEELREQVGESSRLSIRPVDMRRMEIINRLLELLSEQSPANIGVLQSTIVSMFTSTCFRHLNVFFYTPEEIDEGCSRGPSEPLQAATEVGVDDRLVVTIETFESMVESLPNIQLAQLLDAYTDYLNAIEMAWQVTTLEKQSDPREGSRIKSAAGIAIWGEYAYVADSVQHVIFRVSMITDEIMPFCGTRGKPGCQDGPMATFRSPSGLAICESLSTIYVCDTGNDAIRAVAIPSGVVQTLSITPTDSDIRLETPVGICIVRGEYEYEKDSDDDDDGEEDANTVNSDKTQDFDDDEDEDALGSRHPPLLEGITEEDEDGLAESHFSSNRTSLAWGDGMGSQNLRSSNRQANARYTFANSDPAPSKSAALAGRLYVPGKQKRMSMDITGSRRTSGYMSFTGSRRTSGYMSSVSSLSSRRTSTLRTSVSVTPGESAKDSLKECVEEEEAVGLNLAVTSDHCIYLIKPEKGDIIRLAGSHNEYGYKDAEKGADARFSSLKGVTCIRNCLFVADHWNNVIRCINLKTRQVDTVMDFQPCGPIALTVSSSGSVYVLDSEYISVCNILKICSTQCSTKDAEGALGTTMFQMIQESIGRSRSALSSHGSMDGTFLESLSRRGSARQSRRASAESARMSRTSSDAGSRRASQEESGANHSRRNSAALSAVGKTAGHISNLGPRKYEEAHLLPAPVSNMQEALFNGNKSSSRRGSHRGSARSAATTPRLSEVDANTSRTAGDAALPVVPRALRSLVPGASLHPALIQMTLRSRGESHHQSIQTAFTGSQFHVSVVSSVPEDDFEEGPEFFSFLNPKYETPWKTIPIGTLQYVYQEATGQCNATMALTLAYWDAADSDATAAVGMRNTQQLILGGAEWPSVLKVLPPRKASPQDNGRFRAVAVDVDRVVLADSDSNQVFVVNHTKRTKDKIAGCGKAGYLDGPLDVCRMNRPSSIALDPTTHYIYVADAGNHRIRCIDLSTGFMRTVCGNGVKGNRDGNELPLQSLDSPFDLHFMHPGHLLISCADNSIRRLDLQTSQLDTVLVGS